MGLLFGLVLLPAACLLSLGLLSSGTANRHAVGLRRLVVVLTAVQLVLALGMTAARIGGFLGETTPIHLLPFGSVSNVAVSVLPDATALLMWTLVSFVGWVISLYSVRYLDGDANQGRYFRWTGFTIGAVAWMVLAGNLPMFIAAWMTTSLGLHHLLLHDPDRPAARRAAWTKFVISRLGDASLLAAMVLLYRSLGTLDFAAMFTAAGELPVDAVPASLHAACIFLMVGGVTKSAQFPFHTWLPQTMETPTPVSALMHAGIVNAGGYLIIRNSPLLTLSPWVLAALAVLGGVTAVFAAVIMLTQTSVKKALAYSTIAQMGFMMLQCGLGAFSAAMLHILAHSLYKAHAFLSSGSVMDTAASVRGIRPGQRTASLATTMGLGIGCAGMLVTALWLVGEAPWAKPGGIVLGAIVILALTDWLARLSQLGQPAMLARGGLLSGGLCLTYAVAYALVDACVSKSTPTVMPPVWLGTAITASLLVMFTGLFVLHAARRQAIAHNTTGSPRWRAFYVHASNGFYFDALVRRCFGHVASI